MSVRIREWVKLKMGIVSPSKWFCYEDYRLTVKRYNRKRYDQLVGVSGRHTIGTEMARGIDEYIDILSEIAKEEND